MNKMSPEDVTAILNSLQVHYGRKEDKPINIDLLQVLQRLSVVKLDEDSS